MIHSTDHTSITVSDLDASLAFWRDLLGLQLLYRRHYDEQTVAAVTGVAGARIEVALLQGPAHRIELIKYQGLRARQRSALRPCDVGFSHVAYEVVDLASLAAAAARQGWSRLGLGGRSFVRTAATSRSSICPGRMATS